MYVNDRDEINYHGFLFALRNMQNATLWDVATGICTDSEINRVELGERQPEKLMRDRISARLGVSGEEYEDYLHVEEYKQWTLRQSILSALDRKDLAEASKRIEDYAKIEEKNCVQEQFGEVMRYILMQLQGASDEELLAVIERAIALTVPDIDAALDRAHLSSDQEINLFIEYIALKKYSDNPAECMTWKLNQYERANSLIENSYIDTIGKSKILPRIACNMTKLVLEHESTIEQKKRALELCEKAIEALRSASRLFYFIEVVESHSALLSEIKPYRYKKQLERNTEWVEMFKELYAEYGVSAYMETFCYLYWESECHSIVEVLEVRRGMTGLSRVKLSDNICTDKTIVRYERYGFSPSVVVVRDLFERMGMCAEYKRARVITSDPETLYLSNRVVESMNNYDIETSQNGLEVLKERLDMALSFNKQDVLMMETFLEKIKGNLSKEVFYDNTLEALEKTVVFENIERKPLKYLTRSETTCMYNLAFEGEGEKSNYCREYIETLCNSAIKEGVTAGHIPVYELLADGLADYLGDVGRYEESSSLCEGMMIECLKHRHVYKLATFIYHDLWNKQILAKESNDVIAPLFTKTLLVRCKILSEINHRIKLAEFFQQKINDLSID